MGDEGVIGDGGGGERQVLDEERWERVLREGEDLPDGPDDPQLRAIRTAIAVEDALGVVLDEEDLMPEVLGDPAALRRLVARVAGGR